MVSLVAANFSTCPVRQENHVYDASATPEVGKAARAALLTAVDVEALKADLQEVVAKAEKDDPKALRKRIVELERASATAIDPRIEAELQRVARELQTAHEAIGRERERSQLTPRLRRCVRQNSGGSGGAGGRLNLFQSPSSKPELPSLRLATNDPLRRKLSQMAIFARARAGCSLASANGFPRGAQRLR